MESSTVRLNAGAADITLSALDSDSDLLVGGTVRSNREVSKSVRGSDTAGTVVLSSSNDDRRSLFDGISIEEDWRIELTQKIPLTLEFNIGAVSANLDLSELNLARFSVNSGASSIDIIAPRTGVTRGSIDTGAASISVTIPDGVAARITLDGALNSINIDESRFPKVGDRYISPDFETAINKIDLDIDSGVSSVSIR
jgi:hypothetical protein